MTILSQPVASQYDVESFTVEPRRRILLCSDDDHQLPPKMRKLRVVIVNLRNDFHTSWVQRNPFSNWLNHERAVMFYFVNMTGRQKHTYSMLRVDQSATEGMTNHDEQAISQKLTAEVILTMRKRSAAPICLKSLILLAISGPSSFSFRPHSPG